MTPRVASAPDHVKLRSAPLLRCAPALRVTSSSAAARCAYAESRAFGASDSAIITKPASPRTRVDALLLTRPRNRGRLRDPMQLVVGWDFPRIGARLPQSFAHPQLAPPISGDRTRLARSRLQSRPAGRPSDYPILNRCAGSPREPRRQVRQRRRRQQPRSRRARCECPPATNERAP
jgi:hypothetical protein